MLNTVQYPSKRKSDEPLKKTKSLSVRKVTVENKSLTWTAEKPKSAVKQVIRHDPKITMKRSPFNGTDCERFMFLLNNGTIWNFYRNRKHTMWERYLF